MTPVIPCSASSISFFPGSAFTKSKNGCLTRFSSSRKSLKQTLCSQRVFLPLSVSVRVFPLYKFACAQRHTTRTHRLSATETDVVVEEQESPIADEDSSRPPEESSSSIETNDDSSVKSDASITSAQTKRRRPSRKSEMPPVRNEDLIVGATFTGKVRSIQPFGAFVDFGAFTNGLVHVSRLSNSFVKDVSSVVSVGQEVKVKLVEVNMETGRISLSMRENDDKSKPQQRKEAVASSEKGRAPKRNPSRADQKKEEVKKSSKFVKGQDLVGTVKNLTRSGAFISLPEGEEGFLPSSEEADEGMGNLMGNSSLEVGQEVDVCVLRVTRGQVTLTMKKEEDFAELDSLLNQGPVYAATNPFVFAFRANKEIAAFLEEREKLEEEAQISTKPKIPEAADETKEQAETGSEIPNAHGHPVAGGKSIASVSTSLEDTVDSKDKSILAEKEASDMEDASEETPGSEDGKESSVSEISQSLDGAVEILGGEPEVKSEAVDAEGKVSTVDQILDGASAKVELESDTMSVTAKVATDQISSTEKLADQEISVGQIVDHILNDTAKISSPETESLGDTKSDPSIDAADQVSPLAGAVSEEVVVTDQAQTGLEKDEAELPSSTESPDHTKSDLSIASVDGAASEEVSLTHQVEKDEAELPSSTDSSDFTKSDPSEDAVDKVASVDSESSEEVSLTDQAKTGLEKDEAELPSSKESPDYTKYDLSEHAVDKFTSVDSAASEEVALTNQAETGLGKDAIGISISTAETGILAAFSTEDEARVDPISSSDTVVRKELATETQTEDATAKEEVQIQTSISENGIPSASSAEGQLVASFTQKDETTASSNEESYEVSFQQSIVKDQLEIDGKADASGDEASGQLLSSQIQLSEEKAEDKADSNVNSEMPIQLPSAESENSSAKPIDNENGSSATTEDGNVTKSNGSTIVPSQDEISPKATISPALVKQLREETGSGMMDCKKALAETGGDIVKAQEYLRKKGLASAEKKASRVTAEGRISSYIHDSRIGVLIEVNCETDFVSRGEIFKELVDDLAMQVAACPQVDYLVTEDIPKELVDKEREIEMQKEDLLSKPEQIRAKIVDGRIRKRLEELALLEQPYIKNDKVLVKDWVKQTIATIGENIKVKRFVRYNLGEGLEKKSQDFAAEVAAQTAAKPSPVPVKELPASTDTPKPPEKTPTVTVSAALVKQLREETGAGMMDCKKALSETGGDLEKAQEYLRKKGLSTADKKSSRLAAEGRIGSYIHDSRIGVLIEVNCETDFVGRSENFKELVDDLAMQAVACPQVEFVSIDNIPETFVSKEKEIEMQREDILSKPETIREKIVEGRVSKRLGELALLEQPFIKDDSILVKDLVKQTVASLGENIKVRRFVRFALGEQTEDANAEPEA